MAETKNLLTLEFCKQTLLKKEQRSLRFALLFFFGLMPVTITLLVFGIHTVRAYSIFFLFYPAAAILAILALLYLVIYHEVQLGKIKRGAFSLVTDQVSEKREELVSTGRSGRLEKALYFVHYGRYLPSDTVYELTDPGDTFYLVIVEARKPVISLAYHTEMYTDKERSY